MTAALVVWSANLAFASTMMRLIVTFSMMWWFMIVMFYRLMVVMIIMFWVIVIAMIVSITIIIWTISVVPACSVISRMTIIVIVIA